MIEKGSRSRESPVSYSDGQTLAPSAQAERIYARPILARLTAGWGLVALTAVYLLWRVYVALTTPGLTTTDTPFFLDLAKAPIADAMAGLRPPGAPLLYRLTGPDPGVIAAVQGLLSAAAWATLAWQVAASYSVRWVRSAALLVFLLFSLSQAVIRWDPISISESLSNTSFALLVACALRLTRGWQQAWVLGAAIAAVMWALTRDTNAYVLLVLGSAFLGWGIW